MLSLPPFLTRFVEQTHVPVMVRRLLKSVLNGNSLRTRQHRLRETRTRKATSLSGKHLAVLDPARRLILDLLPCADAFTQELAGLWTQIQPGKLWIADRHFCIRQMFAEAAAREACVLLCEHEQLPFTPLTAVEHWQSVEGAEIDEQRVQLAVTDEWPAQETHRICVHLAQPTRDGDDLLHLLCTLPKAVATSAQVAELYHRRWSIEAEFLIINNELLRKIAPLSPSRARHWSPLPARRLPTIWSPSSGQHCARCTTKLISRLFPWAMNSNACAAGWK